MEAYIRGARAPRSRRARTSAASNSVASFFVSRVDTAADKLIEAKIAAASSDADASEAAGAARARPPYANAKIAYQRFLDVFGSERFEKLQAAGAKVQRPLWASTGTKNKAYSDILYVAGAHRPGHREHDAAATIDAFRDHGVVAPHDR